MTEDLISNKINFQMLENQNKKSEIKEILGKPVIDDLSESSHKVRRNLIVFSAVTLMYVKFGAYIDDIQTPIGILRGIDSEEILMASILIVGYHLLHFSFIAIEHLLRIRIRVIKIKKTFDAKDIGDYLNNSWQSTLYSWWSDGIKDIEDKFKEAKPCISEKLLELDKSISNSDNDEQEKNSLRSYIVGMNHNIQKLEQKFEMMKELTSNKKISSSLKRFDTVFRSYGIFQLVRWIVIELLFPIALGISAIYLLSMIN